MQSQPIYILASFLGILALTEPSYSLTKIEPEEKTFIAAKKALNRDNLIEFTSIQLQLQNHHLSPYLEYYFLNKYFETVSEQRINGFINNYPKSPMAKKLLQKKLQNYVDTQQWQLFIDNYQPSLQSVTFKCYYIQALQNQNRDYKHLIAPLWRTGKDQPSNCTIPFEHWLNHHDNKKDLLWQRFELALKKYNFGLSNYLIKLMEPLQVQQAQSILKLYKNPNLITRKSYRKENPSPEVISYGIFRLARRNPNYAITMYSRLKKNYNFNDKQKQRMFQAIALKFALRKNAKANHWFRKVVNYSLDPVYEEWMIRSALYHGDWELVKKAIEAMPQEKKDSSKWTYWYARSLDQLKQPQKAKQIFNELAKTRSYHGFLATRFLNDTIEVKNQPLQISDIEISNVKSLPAYKRSKSLYKLNQKYEARLELYYLMKTLNSKQQYILIKLVSDWGWHAQVLRLSRHAEHKDDVDLRFPLAHYDSVIAEANRRNVDPALIYAIMRQESYFMEKANSHAGAVGLMQLMPATAYRTSKQYNLKYNGREDLLNGTTNIEFGCAHLNKLHQQFRNHPILIIAAYNAGRKNVNRWLPKNKNQKVDADIWVETVPFYETRNYIKQVIAGYVVYQYRLGRQPNLNSIMKKIR